MGKQTQSSWLKPLILQSYLFFPSLILYPHFLLTRGVVGSVHSTQFTQESLITSIFLMWLSRTFFHPQKYLSLEIHLMIVLCRRHMKCLGKWEEQIIDKTVGIFSKAEEKKYWSYSFFEGCVSWRPEKLRPQDFLECRFPEFCLGRTIFVLALEWVPLMHSQGHQNPKWQLNSRQSNCLIPLSTWSGAALGQPVAKDKDRKPKAKDDLHSLNPGVKFTGIIARCNFPAPLSAKCSQRAKHLVNYKEEPAQKCLQIRIMENQKPNAHSSIFFFI